MTDKSKAKYLVIVESPAKAKTIDKILGPDFQVKPCLGHVRDLPERKFGVDLKGDFKPQYEVVRSRKQLVNELAEIAAASEAVYLAPDPDREGEAIAWHLQKLLEKPKSGVLFRRVTYNEITPRAVREAFNHPRDINMQLVDAQQARRVVDRIVGYKVSPLLWQRVRRGLSAGRVQSVALRLVCERELLIRAFIAEEYWEIDARVKKLVDPRDPFVVRLTSIDKKKAEIKTKEQADRILADLRGRNMRVGEVARREVIRRPFPPFITSTLQQAASTRYKLSPANTMRIAQGLYEGVDVDGETTGLITYMRTDSVAIARDAMDACRAYVLANYGEKFVPGQPNVFKSRRGAQEAHEAIRPTDVTRTPEKMAGRLGGPELKLYKLIWERFVASQMTPAIIGLRTVDFEAVANPGEIPSYVFHGSASEVVFPGFMKVSGLPAAAKEKDDEKDDENDVSEEFLPPLSDGETVECLELLSDRKETQPPHRFTEASLIRELEANGVGRPSTYAMILSTLNSRRYVAKITRALVPTDLGMQVSEFLVANLGELFDVGFTALMEESLDKVEEGAVTWGAMLREFYDRFAVWIEKAKGPPADIEKVRWALEQVRGITTWVPPAGTSKRAYSDESFVTSVRNQMEKGEKPVSDKQLAALVKMAYRYDGQLPDIRRKIEDAALSHLVAQGEEPCPQPVTIRKLELLKDVQCAEPTVRGKKIYDDKKFIASLQTRVTGGRGLTYPQIAQLDRLLHKYSSQIPSFEAVLVEFGLDKDAAVIDTEAAEMFKTMAEVKEWDAPTKRGEREFDDRKFHESLRSQFARRGTLSPKQKGALKRMLGKYKARMRAVQAVQDAQAAGGKPADSQ